MVRLLPSPVLESLSALPSLLSFLRSLLSCSRSLLCRWRQCPPRRRDRKSLCSLLIGNVLALILKLSMSLRIDIFIETPGGVVRRPWKVLARHILFTVSRVGTFLLSSRKSVLLLETSQRLGPLALGLRQALSSCPVWPLAWVLCKRLGGIGLLGVISLLLHRKIGHVAMASFWLVLRQNRIIGLSGTRPSSSWLGLMTPIWPFSLGSIQS